MLNEHDLDQLVRLTVALKQADTLLSKDVYVRWALEENSITVFEFARSARPLLRELAELGNKYKLLLLSKADKDVTSVL
jgi:hypothetical protein